MEDPRKNLPFALLASPFLALACSGSGPEDTDDQGGETPGTMESSETDSTDSDSVGATDGDPSGSGSTACCAPSEEVGNGSRGRWWWSLLP